MSRRRPRPSRTPSAASGAAPTVAYTGGYDGTLILDCALVAVAAGLFAVRALVPAESAVFGDTLIVVMLWMAVAAGWLWRQQRSGEWDLRFDLWDWGLLVLAGGHVLSAAHVFVVGGDRRAAANLAWEWIGTALAGWLLVRLFARVAERRLLVASSLALAITLAGYGVWQRYVWYAGAIRDYDAVRQPLDRLLAQPVPVDAEQAFAHRLDVQQLQQQLLRMGVQEHMQSGSGRMLFEARLKESVEPFGRFALANTFGGWLTFWLLVWTGFVWQVRRTLSRVGWAFVAAASGLLLFTLILTKSRTAWAGLLAGLAVWGITLLWQRRQLRPLGTAAAAFLVLGITGGAGVLDPQVWKEAPKSLQYRLEYWDATFDVIRESPLWGVGPGNFRQHYLAHKVPQSSEEIADPHNALLDVWCSGGLVGVVGLGLLVAALYRRPKKDRKPALENSAAATGAGDVDDGRPEWPYALRPVIWGTSAAFVIVLVVGFFLDDALVPLWIAWQALVLLLIQVWPDEEAELPRVVWIAAGTGLLVHLLGAGGIEMPAIVQLLCLCGVGRRVRKISSRPAPRWLFPVGLALVAAGLVACQVTAVGPTLAGKAALQRGDFAKSRFDRVQAYRAATTADAWSAAPWARLSGTAFEAWRSDPRAFGGEFEAAVAAQREAIDRDPRNYVGYHTLGTFWREKYRVDKEPAAAEEGIEALREALERYPHQATLLAELAEFTSAAGDAASARDAARRALAQDELNRRGGHTDKYLPDAITESLRDWAK